MPAARLAVETVLRVVVVAAAVLSLHHLAVAATMTKIDVSVTTTGATTGGATAPAALTTATVT